MFSCSAEFLVGGVAVDHERIARLLAMNSARSRRPFR